MIVQENTSRASVEEAGDVFLFKGGRGSVLLEETGFPLLFCGKI
jgi:hypothetical protein